MALFRRRAHLTQRALGEELCIAEETIASIEQGRRALLPNVAEQMDEFLNTGGALAVAVAELPEREKYPEWAEDFIRHEREAVALSWFENQVLPGLLQTEGYASATFRSFAPPLPGGEVERRVSARLERQAVLDREHLAYSETYLGSRFISDPDQVSDLAQRYGMPRMQALNSEETACLLVRMLGET